MISVPLPALTFLSPGAPVPGRRSFGFSAVTAGSEARTASEHASANVLMIRLRENEIDFPPVLLGGGAFGRPVGSVVQLIRHLGRPVAADVAVEEVALDRLAQAG